MTSAPASARDRIADVLARVYDGQPLTDLRDEHAAHHRDAADAVLAAGFGDRAAELGEAGMPRPAADQQQ